MTEAALSGKDTVSDWALVFDPVEGLLSGVIDLAGDAYTFFKDCQSEVTNLISGVSKLAGTLYSIPKSTWDLITGNGQHGNNFLLDYSKDLDTLANKQDKAARENDAKPWSQRLKEQRDKNTAKPNQIPGGLSPEQIIENGKSVGDLTLKWQEESATLGMASRQAELYKMKMHGVTDEHLKVLQSLDTLLTAEETQKKILESDPYTQVVKTIRTYDTALAENKITFGQYHKAVRDVSKELAGIKSPLDDYNTGLRNLNNAMKSGEITDDEYANKVRELGEAFSGVTDRVAEYKSKLATIAASKLAPDIKAEAGRKALDNILGFPSDPFADYQARKKELDKLRGQIGETNYAQAQQKNVQDTFGIPTTASQKLVNYWNELRKINSEFRQGIINAEQFRAKQLELQGGLDIALSPQQQRQQALDQKAALDKWAAANNVSHDSQQYKDSIKAITPQFVEQLKESTRTPMEKFQEGLDRLNEWKGAGLNQDLYNRGLVQLQQQLGLGEHKLAGSMEYGSNEARETILRNRLGSDANNPQIAILDVSKQQLKEQQQQTAALQTIAQNGGNFVAMTL
jgi:hypothetical protein